MEIAETGWTKQATDHLVWMIQLVTKQFSALLVRDASAIIEEMWKTSFRLKSGKRYLLAVQDCARHRKVTNSLKISNFHRKNDKGVAEQKFAAIGFYL